MPAFYSVEATKIKAGIDARNLGARGGSAISMQNRTLLDRITIPAGLATADTITVARLPKGAIVVPSRCGIHANKKPASTSVAFVVGTAADDDEFSAAITVNAAGTFAFTTATDQSNSFATVADGTSATDIVLTATVTGTPDATSVLYVRIGYMLPG